MITKYSFNIFKPEWPKWKVAIADFFLNAFTFLKVSYANKLLKRFDHLKNVPFIEAVLEELRLEIVPINVENVPKNGPVTIVSNHPGGADVMGMIVALGKVREDVVVLANKLVCVKPVVDIVLPVNVMSKDKKVNMDNIHEAYQAGKVVVFYAAGKNSRYNEDGLLRDRKWRTTFLDFAIKYKTPVVISHISGSNSPFFYKVSNFRNRHKRFNKVPLENIFQLRELINSESPVKIRFSKGIPSDFLIEKLVNKDIKLKRSLADKMRNFLYEMDEHNDNFLEF